MKIETIPITNRSDWLTLRRKDATATDVPALFGVHPYRTALQVYASKKGKDQGPNSAMRRGRILQPAVAEAVREERPDWEITEANTYFRDSERRLGATPDYFVKTPKNTMGVMEAKTVTPMVFQKSWDAGPPLAYTMQTLVQMMLCRVDWGVIACLVVSPDFPLYIYDVERHPAAEAAILEKVDEFWKMVDCGDAPKPNFALDGEFIEAFFPAREGSVINLDGDNELPGILSERAYTVDNIRTLTKRKDELEAQIKNKLMGFETGICRDQRITWKLQHRNEVTIPSKDFRVLRVTTQKDEI